MSLPAYDCTITHNPQVRAVDGKIFISSGGKPHDGKACRRLRALTKDADEPHAHEHTHEIAQTVVELENGSETVVLNDEVKG